VTKPAYNNPAGVALRLRWLRETHALGIPLDVAIAAAPLLWHAKNGPDCTCPNDDYHDRAFEVER